jgi:hypothetical protein
MLTIFLNRAKKAIDLNKNGKIDLWELAIIFVVFFAITIIVEQLI